MGLYFSPGCSPVVISAGRHTGANYRLALRVAAHRHALKAKPAAAGGLEVSASIEALDAYVIGLARAGVAVRHLERRTRSLESLFLELTGNGDAEAAGPKLFEAEPRHESTVAS